MNGDYKTPADHTMTEKETHSLEDNRLAEKRDSPAERPVKLDRHGLPMVPQPTDSPSDPLNWSWWFKVMIVMLVSGLGFIAQVGSAMVNSAYGVIAEDLGETTQRISYFTTTYILLSGVVPMALAPLSNLYGRRILYLLFIPIGVAANIGSGFGQSYGGIIVGRAFNGIGMAPAVVLGAAVISDMFVMSERGFFIGFFALAVSNGPHGAPIFFIGFAAENQSWRWCFWWPAICGGALYLALVLIMPETLYSRKEGSTRYADLRWPSNLIPRGRIFNRHLTARDWYAPFYMYRFIVVVIFQLYYMTLNTWASAMFAVTGSFIATELYGFNTGQIGLLMGLPLLVGCMIGELCTGWLSDQLVNMYAKRHNGHHLPEARLYLAPLAFLTQAGMIAYGVVVDQKQPWWALALCLGTAGVGLQVGTTLTYSYLIDSYRPQASEISAVINFSRQVFAFTVGFYSLPFGRERGFDVSFGVLAGVNGVLLLPVIALAFYGERIRRAQGIPHLHEDL